jgi:hypothetical protein
MEPGKATDLGWVPLDRLPTPLVPHEAAVLRLVASGTRSGYTTFGF